MRFSFEGSSNGSWFVVRALGIGVSPDFVLATYLHPHSIYGSQFFLRPEYRDMI